MQKKKLIILSIIILVIIAAFSSTCYAINPVYGHVYSRGVGSMCYYVNSSASEYTSIINSAVNNWMYTGCGANPIYLTAVSSNYATDMDFYEKDLTQFGSMYANIIAVTRFYNSSSQQLYQTMSNWYYTDIMYNSYQDKFAELPANYKQGTTAHEMGHAFGMAENNTNPNSIMCQLASGRSTQVVTQVDNDTINYLY